MSERVLGVGATCCAGKSDCGLDCAPSVKGQATKLAHAEAKNAEPKEDDE